MTEPLLTISGLHVKMTGNAGEVLILNGLDMQVASGETLAITGPSGSGKTTLLMVMAGLERSSAGSVLFSGRELTTLGEDECARLRRANMGILFQSFHLITTMTALENVALPMDLDGRADSAEMARVALQQVGLQDRVGHYPGELSGGEQQRVGLARALVGEPKLILADEPTGNLDIDTAREAADLLFDLTERTGASLVLITHDETLANRCGRMVRMSGGRLHKPTEATTSAVPS